MATNLLKKNENITPAPTPTWDPFQEMKALLSWDPFRAMRMPAIPEATFVPAFEVKETKDGFLFKADVPGVKEADLEVQLQGERLIISGKRESEVTDKSETYYAYERSYGTFQRVFTLPQGVDVEHARAELKEGVLTVLLPRTAEAAPKKIAVKGAEKVKV